MKLAHLTLGLVVLSDDDPDLVRWCGSMIPT